MRVGGRVFTHTDTTQWKQCTHTHALFTQTHTPQGSSAWSRFSESQPVKQLGFQITQEILLWSSNFLSCSRITCHNLRFWVSLIKGFIYRFSWAWVSHCSRKFVSLPVFFRHFWFRNSFRWRDNHLSSELKFSVLSGLVGEGENRLPHILERVHRDFAWPRFNLKGTQAKEDLLFCFFFFFFLLVLLGVFIIIII